MYAESLKPRPYDSLTSRMNSHLLLSSLQTYLDRRRVQIDRVTPGEMVQAMVDWYRTEPVDLATSTASADTLVYRYGGWSEGCATGFKLSLLRRVRSGTGEERVDWIAGMTMMFDPSRFSDIAPFSTTASEWQSLEAFIRAIESSRGYQLISAESPAGATLEVGGLR